MHAFSRTHPKIPILSGVEPLTRLIDELANARSECEALIREVQAYSWDAAPEVYPAFVTYLYPEQDIDFSQGRAGDAHHLKIKLLALLDEIGPQAAKWKDSIKTIDFCEVYTRDSATPGAKRPCVSGLTAACEVLSTLERLISRAQPEIDGTTSTKRVGSVQPREMSKDLRQGMGEEPNYSSRADRGKVHYTEAQGAKVDTPKTNTRGPRPRDNCKIASIANSFKPWRHHLSEVCDELDEQRVPLSKSLAKKLAEEGIKKPDWLDALDHHEDAVKKSIEYSLRYCKDHTHPFVANDQH